MSDLKSKIDSLEDVITKSDITAPTSGFIVGLKVNTLGAVIRPGDDILEIVPENSDLIVIAKVQINDIDKVKIGLFADIRFSAFDLKNAHVIEGEVIYVSADRFTDEANGEPYYEAKIKVTPEGKKQLKAFDFKLLPGMPAEVMIKIGERTPLSYFVKPFTDMVSRGFNEE
jgi:epimerase transport system membrane fusion protein